MLNLKGAIFLNILKSNHKLTDIIDQLFTYPTLEVHCVGFCIILEKKISKAGNHTLYGVCMHEQI